MAVTTGTMLGIVENVRLEPPVSTTVTLAQDLVPGWYRCYGEGAPSLRMHVVRLDPDNRRVYLEYTQHFMNDEPTNRKTYSDWDSPWHMVLDEYIIEELELV